MLLAPPLASIAVAFGPFENFAVIVLALILISSLSEGSFLKGLSAGLLGMLVSYPGIDESSGIMRLTFGFSALEGGFNSLPVILGMFAVSQVVADALNIEDNASAIKATMRGMFMSLRDYVVARLEHAALVADRHLDRHPAGRRRDRRLDRRLHDGQEPLAQPGGIRDGQRGGDRRGRERQQRDDRRHARSRS